VDEPSSNQTEEQTGERITDPLFTGKIENHATLGSHKASGANSASKGGDSNGNPSRNFLRRLTINEWLTFFVASGSLAVSILTWRTVADTSDIKTAIGNLTELATQTKRQADATHEQAEAAVEAAKTAREAFIASDRGRIGVTGATVDPHAGNGGFNVAVVFLNYGKEAVILSKEWWARSFDDSEWSGGIPWIKSAPGKYISDLEAQCLSRDASAASTLATPYIGNNSYALNFNTIADLPPVYSISADKDFLGGKTRLVFFACFSYDVNGVTKHTYVCEWYKAKPSPGPIFCESGNRAQ
jgi:hypothetical protein